MNDLEKLRNPSLAEFEQTHEAVVNVFKPNGLNFKPKGLKSNKMNDLEMIKAFAELEGIELSKCGMYYESTIDEYNPITNLALNCAARDKYEVDVNYHDDYVTTWCGMVFLTIAINSKKGIPRAVIECILKSEGKL